MIIPNSFNTLLGHLIMIFQTSLYTFKLLSNTYFKINADKNTFVLSKTNIPYILKNEL